MKKLIPLLFVLILSACGSEADNEEIPPPNIGELAFFDSFNFFDGGSTCAPTNINERVISAYTNEEFTEFELRRADQTVWLSGDLDESLIHTFQANIDSEPANCFIQFQTALNTLYQECQSASTFCKFKWF